jgi:sulfate adenylyltransferase subunit 1
MTAALPHPITLDPSARAHAQPALATQPQALVAAPLRIVSCGSVDDGKSTLIGRLLYDSKAVLSDHIAAIARSKAQRAASGELDLSLLTDGLEAEREQGITIDVAYRYFATPRRKFILADAPGHEQYTRNMVTAASNSDVAVVLVDVSKLDFGRADGRLELLPQTRRHAALASLLGVAHIVLAVNKIDTCGYDAQRCARVVEAFAAHARSAGWPPFSAVPISALRGDNVVERSAHTPWYDGPPLLALLESLDAQAVTRLADAAAPLRLALQAVVRSDGTRWLLGRLASGTLSEGDEVQAAGQAVRVTQLRVAGRPALQAQAGASVAIAIDRAVDLSRGDWIFGAAAVPAARREVEAALAWLDDEPLAPQRKYWLRHGTRWTQARVQSVEAMLDLADMRWKPPAGAALLGSNAIARARLLTHDALPFEPYARSRAGGAFVLVDAGSHRTVAAGMAAG